MDWRKFFHKLRNRLRKKRRGLSLGVFLFFTEVVLLNPITMTHIALLGL